MNYPRFFMKFSIVCLIGVAGLGLLGVLCSGGAYLYYAGQLPKVTTLGSVQYEVPLRIYTSDGKLMGEYGAERRAPMDYEQFPPQLIHAFLAAEDGNFFHEPGVDWKGLLRAAIHLAETGRKTQGGSTITMQVARNFFLSDAKTYSRKFKEIILALKINHDFSKKQILQLYLNKIYLGNRAYGVGAAAQVYYGKDVSQLSLAQMAMIAGLPQAPSAANPIASPKRALARRNYVLRRMHELHYISDQQYRQALQEPVTAQLQGPAIRAHAAYVSEMIRAEVVKEVGQGAYTDGYSVISTIDSRRQAEANKALRDDLMAYEYRHGYRGPEAHIDLKKTNKPPQWDDRLSSRGRAGNLKPALVLSVQGRRATVYTVADGKFQLGWDALSWAKAFKGPNREGPAPQKAADVLSPGDIIRLAPTGDKNTPWKVASIPKVQGALVALNPSNGAIEAMVGGFDYFQSKYNRAMQAKRQPGSSFKPFLYSAAINKGMTAATMINDAPVVYDAPGLNKSWRPENYERRFSGPTRLREGLVHSLNLVSIRILRDIGVEYVRDYASRFGLPLDQMPKNLSLALGSASFSPLQMVRGYSVFANGGYLVNPHYIRRITGPNGQMIFQARPALACDQCSIGDESTNAPRVITPQNAYIMTSLMQGVIRNGTGRAALSLNRKDLAGKTGTTNDQRDAWFSGFNSNLATTVWVGYDQPATLGFGETGAHAALPAWMEFMGAALKDAPEATMPRPAGLVTVRINPDDGKAADANTANAVFETFRKGHVPPPDNAQPATPNGQQGEKQNSGSWVQQLY